MIYTSNYKSCNTTKYNVYSISKDKGEDAGYIGDCYLILAPKREFFKKWRHNRGIVPELDNNKYYIREFYNKVLKELDPEAIYNELDNSILLCYEEHNEFCHRHIVAAWFELTLGVKVLEIKVNDDKLEKLDRPIYIKEYLKEII